MQNGVDRYKCKYSPVYVHGISLMHLDCKAQTCIRQGVKLSLAVCSSALNVCSSWRKVNNLCHLHYEELSFQHHLTCEAPYVQLQGKLQLIDLRGRLLLAVPRHSRHGSTSSHTCALEIKCLPCIHLCSVRVSLHLWSLSSHLIPVIFLV